MENNQNPIFPRNAQFPGSTYGAKLSTVRRLVSKQKKIKGYRFTTPTGNSTQTLQLPGEAKMLLGVKLYNEVAAVDFTLSILVNNEKIVDTVHTAQFDSNPSNSNQQQEYLAINRPLAGQDTINVEFTNNDVNANVTVLHIFYL